MLKYSKCRLSSVVEQHFCKVKVVGSNPTGGSIIIFRSEAKDGKITPTQG